MDTRKSGNRSSIAIFEEIMSMDTTVNAQVSSFADGEHDATEISALLKLVREPGGRAAWDEYHLIGDVLRSNESAVKLRPDFGAQMTARLADEPTYISPASTAMSVQRGWKTGVRATAIAATVLLTVLVGPRLIGPQHLALVAHESGATSAGAGIVTVSAAKPGTVVLRDAQIDEYLLAHQRFSPSLYSTALYARSSTFVTESDK
jgi:sigma-E factor negative regulatory protein RseA